MLARSNAPAWLMATNTVGVYPGKIVARLNRYVDWLFDAAPDVPEVTQTFLGVMHLVTPSAAPRGTEGKRSQCARGNELFAASNCATLIPIASDENNT
jgi:hypothetical protein